MSQSNPISLKTYPPELQVLVEKANKGDVKVLPELKKAFNEHPELTAQFGDLVGNVVVAFQLKANPCAVCSEKHVNALLVQSVRALKVHVGQEHLMLG
jgi:hypothetical protein